MPISNNKQILSTRRELENISNKKIVSKEKEIQYELKLDF